MTSRHSDSLVLAWQVAAAEARHLRSPQIEPHHLLLGLCKLIDLDIIALVSETSPNRDAVLEELLREVRRLRDVFRNSGFDPKILRRKLRRAYGKDSLEAIDSEPLRRSERAKEVFLMAEKWGDVTHLVVFPVHLLYAVLNIEDVRRDSVIAGLGFDKDKLIRNAKNEIFLREGIDAKRKAARKIARN